MFCDAFLAMVYPFSAVFYPYFTYILPHFSLYFAPFSPYFTPFFTIFSPFYKKSHTKETVGTDLFSEVSLLKRSIKLYVAYFGGFK